MALEITQHKELEKLLADKPAQWSHLIAARAALRMLPLALTGIQESDWLPVLRACFISWAVGQFPAHDMTVAARSAARFGSVSSGRSAVNSAARSVRSAALSATRSADHVALSVDSAESAADSASLVANFVAESAVWMSISADVTLLYETKNKTDIADFVQTPLWAVKIPLAIAKRWQSFVDYQHASHFAPWINWYQSLLTGNGPSADFFGPDLTLRIAQQPDEWWDRPVAEVNADVTRWLEEAKEGAVVVPPPEPGLVGTVDADGRVGFARSGEATEDELAGIGGLLQILTGAAEDLAALLVGNNSVAIAPSIVPQYLACLQADSLSIDRLYAAGVRLGNARAKLQKQIDSKDYPDLAPDVAEALDSVLELHGPVLLSTAEGRRLVGASSDYLRTAADSAALKRAAMDYGQAVAKSPDLFNKETRELLPELNEDVASGPHPERSTQVAMSASRNLLITVARVVLFETLKNGLAASVVGMGMIGVTAQTINFAWAFLTSYLPVIRELAAVSGPYLQWIEPLLRKAEKRLRE
ncbi:MAG: hypothetical protein JHC88_04455 [Niveispirillum sp.]|nr:hypothetical protein [Niveispirillum sp.]